MKYLRKFSSVQEMNAAMADNWTGILGMVDDGTTKSIKNHVFVPQPDDEIWYTSTDGNIVAPNAVAFGDGITVVSNTYNNGKGVIKLSGNATKIGNGAFQNSNLKSINMPNGITYVDDNAFYGSFYLTKVKLSKNITTIGNHAFQATQLSSITLPDTVTTIRSDAFVGCKFKTFDMPDSVTTIGDEILGFCEDLVSVKLSKNITAISAHMFHGCAKLKSLTIPYGVTYIGAYAINGCHSLTSLVLPDSVTELRDHAIFNNSNLTSVTMSNNITTIGPQVFNGCKKLTSITIPVSVTSIGSSAFENCAMKTLTVPNTVNTIGNNAFKNVLNVVYNGSATGSPWGAKYYNKYVEGDFVYTDNTKTTLVKYLGNDVSVTIPDGVVTISQQAFSEYSTKITTINIPSSVTTIGQQAFKYCKLASVIVPDTVNSIGADAFNGTINLNYNGSATGSPWGAIVVNGYAEGDFVYTDNTKTILVRYTGNNSEVTIPSTVTAIGDNAFRDYYNLISVKIPNSVTTIGNYVFYDCYKLRSIVIPSSVISIGNHIFENCSDLKEVTMSDGIVSIGKYAFGGCYNIETLTVPNTVNTIGNDAFRNVLNVVYNGSATGSPWGATVVNGYVEGDFLYTDNTKTTLVKYTGEGETITIPNSVVTIGNHAFQATQLSSLTMSDTVTTIGSGAFGECGRLTDITISNNLTTIGEYAFSCCEGLTSIVLPATMQCIGEAAFEECNNLTTVTCLATTPPEAEYAPFGYNYSDITIYVPAGSVDVYKTATNWSTYASRIQAIQS